MYIISERLCWQVTIVRILRCVSGLKKKKIGIKKGELRTWTYIILLITDKLIIMIETTWKGKYQSMDNTKYGKGKGNLLPKIEEIPEERHM